MQTSAAVGHKGAHSVGPRSLGTGLVRTVQHSLGLRRLRVPCMAQANREAAQDAEERLDVQQLQQQLEMQQQLEAQRAARKAQRETEQAVYKGAAIAATSLIGSIATAATYYRILWHLEDVGEFPWLDLAATLSLVAAAAVFMEVHARWAHKAWHDRPLGWAFHKSHHEPRLGPYELNDVFAIVNAPFAMALCAYGFLEPSLVGSLCFGAGLGITLFGLSYVFVHDGMVHRRFPVGPLADMPYFKKVVLAHQLHHSEKYGGVPFGLFFGPQELEEVGAGPELERMMVELGNAKKAKA